MKKCKIIVLCLIEAMLLTSCGKEKEKETFFLKPDADMQGGYEL